MSASLSTATTTTTPPPTRTMDELLIENRCLKESLTVSLEMKRILDHMFEDRMVLDSGILNQYEAHYFYSYHKMRIYRRAFDDHLVNSIERLDDTQFTKCYQPSCLIPGCNDRDGELDFLVNYDEKEMNKGRPDLEPGTKMMNKSKEDDNLVGGGGVDGIVGNVELLDGSPENFGTSETANSPSECRDGDNEGGDAQNGEDQSSVELIDLEDDESEFPLNVKISQDLLKVKTEYSETLNLDTSKAYLSSNAVPSSFASNISKNINEDLPIPQTKRFKPSESSSAVPGTVNPVGSSGTLILATPTASSTEGFSYISCLHKNPLAPNLEQSIKSNDNLSTSTIPVTTNSVGSPSTLNLGTFKTYPSSAVFSSFVSNIPKNINENLPISQPKRFKPNENHSSAIPGTVNAIRSSGTLILGTPTDASFVVSPSSSFVSNIPKNGNENLPIPQSKPIKPNIISSSSTVSETPNSVGHLGSKNVSSTFSSTTTNISNAKRIKESIRPKGSTSSPVAVQLFKCRVIDCSQTFVNKIELENHFLTHLKLFKCSICESLFTKRELVFEHFAIGH